MAMEPNRRLGVDETEEEYRKRQELRAKRRQKRRMQRMMIIGAFALAVVVVVVCIIMIFRAILGDKEEKPNSADLPNLTDSWTTITGDESGSVDLTAPPIPTGDRDKWQLLLVNGSIPLPEGFALAKEDLGTVGQNGVVYYFDKRIMDDFVAMVTDCNAAGNDLQVVSGYRGADRQNKNYEYLKTVYMGGGMDEATADVAARRIDPPAGYSEHQTGLAVDFITGTVNETRVEFDQTPEFAWLMDNAANYGFILRYPEEKTMITEMDYQPYHWRYVGPEDAKVIKEAGLCLEEYLASLPGDKTE